MVRRRVATKTVVDGLVRLEIRKDGRNDVYSFRSGQGRFYREERAVDAVLQLYDYFVKIGKIPDPLKEKYRLDYQRYRQRHPEVKPFEGIEEWKRNNPDRVRENQRAYQRKNRSKETQWRVKWYDKVKREKPEQYERMLERHRYFDRLYYWKKQCEKYPWKKYISPFPQLPYIPVEDKE